MVNNVLKKKSTVKAFEDAIKNKKTHGKRKKKRETKSHRTEQQKQRKNKTLM